MLMLISLVVVAVLVVVVVRSRRNTRLRRERVAAEPTAVRPASRPYAVRNNRGYYEHDDCAEEEYEEEEVCDGSGRCSCFDCERAAGENLALKQAQETGDWSNF